MPNVLLSLGANTSSITLKPVDQFRLSLSQLEKTGGRVIDVSPLYRSAAVGPVYQPDFYNAAALIETSLPPVRLLKVIKGLELSAGRRGGLFWGPRPLDIDLIDYQGVVLNWKKKQVGGSSAVRWLPIGQGKVRPLCLPHPEMHRRVFVLKPLHDIAPDWCHPLFNMDARHLMMRYCSPLVVKTTEKLEKFW
jgi:2-amino-4-hydroxy-6-hydroxymethyldihydropteridine diphosphokinase